MSGYSCFMKRAWKKRAAVAVAASMVVTLLGYGACSFWYLEPRATPVQAQRRAPDFALPDHTGREVTLRSLLAKGPVVVIFYRGFW